MLDDEEEQQVVEKNLQDCVIIQTDIKDNEIISRIIKYANEMFEIFTTDKQLCTDLKRLLDADPLLNNPSNPQNVPNSEEHGVWQCIIGRQFCASVTFDAEYLIYFHFPKHSKYFMIFRS